MVYIGMDKGYFTNWSKRDRTCVDCQSLFVVFTMASNNVTTQRIVYIVTYSRADMTKFPTRESFAKAVTEA